MTNNATSYIERMLAFALKHSLIESIDTPYARNLLLYAMGMDAPEPTGDDVVPVADTLTGIIEPLEDMAAKRGLIDDTPDARERFGVRLCGLITPHPATVRRTFESLRAQAGAKAATDWFYRMCRASDYIRVDHIARNVKFTEDGGTGPLEITINLSKPEKDPRDIAAALGAKRVDYPPCMLCIENPGYAGRNGYPARQNHRVVPVMLGGERFYLQYSPYLYYDEHSIVFNERHVPMQVNRTSIARLFDFVDQFPHYMIGSNADLPIVGGSILTHDHFQGGAHLFPMEKAGEEFMLTTPYPGVQAAVVNWPMSCIRLWSTDADALIGAADDMLLSWRAHSDAACDILAYTDQPHNTITPIVRKQGSRYIMHLVLRNNRTDDRHPMGIFHPHADLHHIKKENIGLIEVMGLFILPGRLIRVLDEARAYLTGARALADKPDEADEMHIHYEWVLEIARESGANLTREAADAAVRRALARKCARVLTDAGVYKQDDAGRRGLMRFLGALDYKNAGV